MSNELEQYKFCIAADCELEVASNANSCHNNGRIRNTLNNTLITHTHTHRHTRTHTHTQPFNSPLSRTTRVSRYQKGKTNLDFTEATDSEWQRHQRGHMQGCTSIQTDNHVSTPPLSFFTGRMPFLPPNQQCQSTEGMKLIQYNVIKLFIQRPLNGCVYL